MKSLDVSRRRLMALVGASLAMAPAVVSAAHKPSTSAKDATRTTEPDVSADALLAPLVVGSQLAAWQVQRISGVRLGAVTLQLTDGSEPFFLDICGRDDSLGAPVPPGRSDKFDVFVANLGDGSRPTHESHGLAAMALAEVLRTNEHRVSVPGMLTLRDRLARFPSQVLRGF